MKNWNPDALHIEMRNDVVTLENSLAISQNLNTERFHILHQFYSSIYTQRNCKHISTEKLAPKCL